MTTTIIPFVSPQRCSHPEELAFATMFAIPHHLAQILFKLYQGETMKPDRRHISELRSVLDPEAIDTMVQGYRLTDQGQVECKAAIAGFKGWVARKLA